MIYRIVITFFVFCLPLLGCSSNSSKKIDNSSQQIEPLGKKVLLRPKTNQPNIAKKANDVHPLDKDATQLNQDQRTDIPGGPPKDLRIAMDRLEESLRSKNTTSFLSHFSRKRDWYDINTLDGNRKKTKISYARLKRELLSKTGLYTTLFDADGDDCLRDYTVGPYSRPWRWLGNNKFAPPNSDERAFWIAWRIEDGRWMVDAIAQPSA
jgi:hypothetical protein